MVDVRVGEDHRVDALRAEGERLVVEPLEAA